MHNVTLPTPKIQVRKPDPEVLQAATETGLHPLLARIIASRPAPTNLNIQQMLESKLNCLDHPLAMQDMDKASVRLADAIMSREVIGIETDHDCDGQTSHAVLFYNLVHKFGHPQDLVRSYIGHRLTEGYGLSMPVANRILNDSPRPTLVITADNGSTDEERIALLKNKNIDVIVTDHHQLPIAGPPQSAYACLNPSRIDCKYPDSYIAGCMVAWLLIAATRLELIKREYITQELKINDSLDFVAVGTVADCVSMGRSYNNRAIVNYGLKLINSGIKPCWRAVKPLVNKEMSAEDLAFKVGPLLNSDGRLASAFGSVSFLLSEDDITARQWVTQLQEQNQIRRSIQNKITEQGLHIATAQTDSGRYSLCILLIDGHSGVHGISASKIKEAFGRPTVFLATKHGEEHILTGSIRGIDGFHVGQALQWIMQNKPGLLIAGGGHAGAGGVSLLHANYPQFNLAFEEAARVQLTDAALGPVIWTDGEITSDLLTLDTLKLLSKLEPFGREFEAPVFEMTAKLVNLRTIGDGTHARVELALGNKNIAGVWFSFKTTAEIGDMVRCAFSLRANDFGGTVRCEIQIICLDKVKV